MMTRIQIVAFLGLSVAFWMILLAIRGMPLSWEMLLPFSAVVGAVSTTLLVFDAWAWKLPIFRGWLVKRPVIHGTWKAILQSDWINPQTNEGIGPIDGFVVVRQSASKLSIQLFTKESRSTSVSSAIDECYDGTFNINCTYCNHPKSEHRDRSEVHYGAMLLFVDNANPERVEGEYWTDRKTNGSIALIERSKQTCATFTEAQQIFNRSSV